ncbi:MAG: hypothetical protein DME97_03530 [Verrucomicrobia bacterium]|nr:MAG: hypothetical protein DME97_03530 [Verrucomicrobiota bacterium]
MKTIGPYQFIHIGLLIRLLRRCQHYSIVQVMGEVKKLVDGLKKTDFSVSLAGTNKLQELSTELGKEKDKSRKITAAEEAQFSEIINVLELMVVAEASTKRLYLLDQSRFNLEGLLSNPSIMFSSGTFSRLPHIAKQDVASAFQCLAFDQPTASAFHILRACEAVLKAYYFTAVKRVRLETPMWGNMLEALRKKRKPDDKLLERLKYVKDSFRNPTSHPESVYTLTETQDLIGICIDVINRMAVGLPDAPEADDIDL